MLFLTFPIRFCLIAFQRVLWIPGSSHASLQLVREGYPAKDDRHRPHGSPQGRQTQVQKRLQGGHRRRFAQEEGLSREFDQEYSEVSSIVRFPESIFRSNLVE